MAAMCLHIVGRNFAVSEQTPSNKIMELQNQKERPISLPRALCLTGLYLIGFILLLLQIRSQM